MKGGISIENFSGGGYPLDSFTLARVCSLKYKCSDCRSVQIRGRISTLVKMEQRNKFTRPVLLQNLRQSYRVSGDNFTTEEKAFLGLMASWLLCFYLSGTYAQV